MTDRLAGWAMGFLLGGALVLAFFMAVMYVIRWLGLPFGNWTGSP